MTDVCTTQSAINYDVINCDVCKTKPNLYKVFDDYIFFCPDHPEDNYIWTKTIEEAIYQWNEQK